MPAPLALLGCTIFVLALLRLESRQKTGGVTPFLWIPTIWFLLTCSRPPSLWFGIGGETIEEGNPIDQIVLIGLLALAVVILIRRQFPWLRVVQTNKWPFILLAFTLISILWSATPFISFKRWFREEMVAIIMCIFVLSEPQPRVAAESILRRVIYICIPYSYVLIHYFPEFGRTYVHHSGDLMWIGVTEHKNQLCQICLLSFLYLAWKFTSKGNDLPRSRLTRFKLWGDILILLIALLDFMGPYHRIDYSATSLMSTLFGMAILALLRWHHRRGTIPGAWIFICLTVCSILYGTLTPFVGKLPVFDQTLTSAVGRTAGLTGRADVWTSLIPAVMEQPVLGYGFGGFWTTEARERYDISDSHNGFLGVVLEAGFFGWMLYISLLIYSAKTLYGRLNIDFDWAAFCLVYLLGMILHNIGEASLTSFSSQLTAEFLLVLFAWKPTFGRIDCVESTVARPALQTK